MDRHTCANLDVSSRRNQLRHFEMHDYEKFGRRICESLRQYLDIRFDSTYEQILSWVQNEVVHLADWIRYFGQ